MTSQEYRRTRMLFLPLLSLALVQCSSADELPRARSADQNLVEDDSVLRCNESEDVPDQTYDARVWNRVLYVNEELRQASGISRITNCQEARVVERVCMKYLQDHPDFIKVWNERFAAVRRLIPPAERDETSQPQIPRRKGLDEEEKP